MTDKVISKGLSVMYWENAVLRGPAIVVRSGGSSVTLRLPSGAPFKVPRGNVEVPKRRSREIVEVFLVPFGTPARAPLPSRVAEFVAHCQGQGRNPRVLRRGLRAEWLGADCYVVTADVLGAERPEPAPAPPEELDAAAHLGDIGDLA